MPKTEADARRLRRLDPRGRARAQPGGRSPRRSRLGDIVTRRPAPVEAGRFIVAGSHALTRSAPGKTDILIEAGPAFGTGHHGTTLGCLLGFEHVLRTGVPKTVLDVGTGSGVLGDRRDQIWFGARDRHRDRPAERACGERKRKKNQCRKSLPRVSHARRRQRTDPECSAV